MNRTKYDGKLTNALIQTVVEAENRLNGLMSGRLDELRYSPSGAKEEPISQPDVEASRLAELADYQRSLKPTPAERAAAWARNHRDYEPESVGHFDPDEDTE
jgi:hypothetical protein